MLVAPRLEVLAAQASPVGALGMPIRDWGDLDDPYALVASLVPGARGWRSTTTCGPRRCWRCAPRCPAAEQVLAGPVLSHLRMRKDATEVAALVAAGAAIDRVHAAVPALLRPGRTEREVGADIADLILADGHVRVDFVIVGSGPNGASPHHEVSDRVIERRRRRRRRHRRHDAGRLPQRLHAHLRGG